ncbi:hypothetical protein BDA96_09G051600 [Sorghum bicolor]|uniref:Uncharacterized protein n=2 Tax=Sorghum bicolor TaxID=4558 RepID=A0A921U3V4_SORBI|nr:hypothetical protein BDA96_09G051600 [Sorghum bicolor]OQU77430.1 hypothetical protein SORBI_3009G048350 [Sorghum bicolor]
MFKSMRRKCNGSMIITAAIDSYHKLARSTNKTTLLSLYLDSRGRWIIGLTMEIILFQGCQEPKTS